MRPLQTLLFNNQVSTADLTSSAIDFRQIVSFSVQASASTGAMAGTFQMQVSNTPCLQRFIDYGTSSNPVTWTNLGSPLTFAQASVASSQLLPKVDSSYVAMRLLFSSTPGAVTTIVASPDVAGSLNNTYFLFSSSTTAYYVWFNVNSAGTNPSLAGRTGIEIDIATGATAATIGGLLRTAMAVTGVVITGSSATVIATGANASDGAAPTGFNFTPSSVNTSNITAALSALGL